MVKCVIWKIGDICRISVNDIRFRKLGSACISDLGVLLETMEDIKKKINGKLPDEEVVFEVVSTTVDVVRLNDVMDGDPLDGGNLDQAITLIRKYHDEGKAVMANTSFPLKELRGNHAGLMADCMSCYTEKVAEAHDKRQEIARTCILQ